MLMDIVPIAVILWDYTPVQSSSVLVHLTSLALDMPHMDLVKSNTYI